MFKIVTSGVEEVEVAEPVGVKEEVLLDEKWSGADEEKCDQQADRRRGDRSLHYQAVGAERRIQGDRSEERQDKGEESIDPVVLSSLSHSNLKTSGKARQRPARAMMARTMML